ncbi:hypothetical protein Fmac_011988 [Flemingia macrophylla]|uniref:Ribosomal protein S3 n=1 Tax=Flemingia macrophylla TaxID=520843 RepID=A0ABD1MP12_9FABA
MKKKKKKPANQKYFSRNYWDKAELGRALWATLHKNILALGWIEIFQIRLKTGSTSTRLLCAKILLYPDLTE